MKKSVKILSAVMAVVLVFTCGVGATLAYLNAKAEAPVVNTFCAKNLVEKPEDFQLWEHNVKYDEKTAKHVFTDDKAEVKGVNYERVTPGEILPKDPFVRVKNVENAYLFIEVKNDLAPGMTYKMDSTWEAVKENGTQLVGENGGLIFVKKVSDPTMANDYVLAAREANVEYDILNPEHIEVANNFDPANATPEKQVALTVWGYLTQAANFDDYNASWAASPFYKAPATK